jgi:hypothetical protein
MMGMNGYDSCIFARFTLANSPEMIYSGAGRRAQGAGRRAQGAGRSAQGAGRRAQGKI